MSTGPPPGWRRNPIRGRQRGAPNPDLAPRGGPRHESTCEEARSVLYGSRPGVEPVECAQTGWCQVVPENCLLTAPVTIPRETTRERCSAARQQRAGGGAPQTSRGAERAHVSSHPAWAAPRHPGNRHWWPRLQKLQGWPPGDALGGDALVGARRKEERARRAPGPAEASRSGTSGEQQTCQEDAGSEGKFLEGEQPRKEGEQEKAQGSLSRSPGLQTRVRLSVAAAGRCETFPPTCLRNGEKEKGKRHGVQCYECTRARRSCTQIMAARGSTERHCEQ